MNNEYPYHEDYWPAEKWPDWLEEVFTLSKDPDPKIAALAYAILKLAGKA